MQECAKKSDKTIGAVMVVGGGIGGIQASLDLAEAGYKVYLVEKSPAIGGVMAQLDKTFPTLDCSMCILSPKLIECGRHPNIELLTCSELMEVDGLPGDFKAKIVRHPRFVDESKCTGCGECAEVCPIEAPSEFEQGLAERKAVYRPFAQAYPNAFAVDKRKRAPCTLTCPAGTNVQGYVALCSQGKFAESLEVMKEKLPIPRALGRICPAPCEEKCNRQLIEEPLAIREIKRFVADTAKGQDTKPEIEEKEGKVAIIGSGPAGLSCAYFLRLQGYQPTIFEALPKAGGMLQVGIPGYRLPKDVLKEEIQEIADLGIEIKTNSPIGDKTKIEDLMKKGYKAVFIGVGAHGDQKLGIPNEDAKGVIPGVELLRDINLGKDVKTKGKVVVVGGGDVAIDAARSALRQGADDVTILYRRTRVEMPARAEEIEGAEEEGIKIEYLVAPLEVVTKGNEVAALKCTKMELGEPDASGRRRPMPIEGSEFDMPVDIIIPAIGQSPQTSPFAKSGIELTKKGTVKVDEITLQTSKDGVFAGGDCQTGPWIAVGAVAEGARAAESIARLIEGKDLKEGRTAPDKTPAELDFIPWGEERQARENATVLSVDKRAGYTEIELALTEEQAVKEAGRCLDCGLCCECKQCVVACQADAITSTTHDMTDQIAELNVGSVILCPGFDEFDPTPLYQYGYRKYPNVVSSIEFERMLSASGPFQGHLIRPSDGKEPKNIAWIQCVGSRDESIGRGYCSSVCCTYAIKEGMIAKEHVDYELNETIFYMDIRTHGKDFDKFYEKGKAKGIDFVRAKVYGIEAGEEEGNLKIKFLGEDDRNQSREFDLVVLSVGLDPSPPAVDMAKRLDVQLNKYGFAHTDTFSPVETSRDGVFVCGAFQGPKDIPETVMQASGAAGSVSALLSDGRNTLTTQKEYPEERNVTGEEPRIGVFICHCGINIGGYLDVPGVTEYAKTLPGVEFADCNLYTCSSDTQDKIKQAILDNKLNRLVVASCTPRTHEPLFQETLREAGLNKYLFEMANIRDQCSWVHMNEPEAATAKAKDLVRMAAAKVALKRSLLPQLIPVNHSALVIGGGVAGMVSALTLAEQGFKVHIVEKNSELGGITRKMHYTLTNDNVQAYLADLIKQVDDNPNIKVNTDTWIVDAYGYVGNFTTEVMRHRGVAVEKIEHGATIVACGAEEYKPEGEYLYGKDPRVLTQSELEDVIVKQDKSVMECDNLVMIQCVGCRNEKRPYCGRTCCNQAVANALKLKALKPDMNIYVFYRDIRTYGFNEDFYHEARRQGVMFINYDPANPPKVTQMRQGERYMIRVEGNDPVLEDSIAIDADILALSVSVVPVEEAKEVATFYKVPINEDGFFLEAHVKLRPVDFATDGVFLCGLAHAPKSLDEIITQAEAAASRAGTILAKETIMAEGIVSSIDEDMCSACGTCETVCPYSAIHVNKERGVAEVNEALCKGCGTCCAACPSGAAQQRGFSKTQIGAMVRASLGV